MPERQSEYQKCKLGEDIPRGLRSIYLTLSNEDSFTIFDRASQGIGASSALMKELGISKKRYYNRMRRLKDLGLIRKESGEYRHTRIGNLVYHNQVDMLEALASMPEATNSDSYGQT